MVLSRTRTPVSWRKYEPEPRAFCIASAAVFHERNSITKRPVTKNTSLMGGYKLLEGRMSYLTTSRRGSRWATIGHEFVARVGRCASHSNWSHRHFFLPGTITRGFISLHFFTRFVPFYIQALPHACSGAFFCAVHCILALFLIPWRIFASAIPMMTILHSLT